MIKIKALFLGVVALSVVVAGVLTVGSHTAYASTTATGQWTSAALPEPPDYDYGILTQVSCPSVDFCQAVGLYDDTNSKRHGFIESYNGTTWTVASLTDPPGTYDSTLSKIHCVSSTFCVAIGGYRDANSNNDTRGLIYTYDGTSWTSQTSPQPGPGQYVYLNSIDCVSVTYCQIVGAYQSNMQVETHTLAMTYDGTSWSLASVSDPTGATSASLQDIDCISTTFCQAVGSYVDGSSNAHTMTQGYNGTTWSVLASADPQLNYNYVGLSHVRCISTTFCQAIGGSFQPGNVNMVITKSFDGSAWTDATIGGQAGYENAVISGFECLSATSCQAVGSYNDSNGISHQYLQSYDATGWKVHTLSEPAEATSSRLAALSCASANTCQALGSFGTAAQTYPGLSESYDGTDWSAGTGLEPADFMYTNVASIDCASTTSCEAVGTFTDQSNNTRLMVGDYRPAAVVPPASTPAPLPEITPALNAVTKTSNSVVSRAPVQTSTPVPSNTSNNVADVTDQPASSPRDSQDASPSNAVQNQAATPTAVGANTVYKRSWWWVIIVGGVIALVIAIGLLRGKRTNARL